MNNPQLIKELCIKAGNKRLESDYMGLSQPKDSSGYAIELSLIQRWLRNQHNIHVNTHWSDNGKYDVYVKAKPSKIMNKVSETSLLTYEDALEEGIIFALKHLTNEKV